MISEDDEKSKLDHSQESTPKRTEIPGCWWEATKDPDDHRHLLSLPYSIAFLPRESSVHLPPSDGDVRQLPRVDENRIYTLAAKKL